MARLVPSKILAPLWSATQFSTILVLAFCNLTITPWANMTVAGETVLIVEIDFPVVIMSGRTGAVILMSVKSVAGKVSNQYIPVGWARCPSNMVRLFILLDPALCSRTFSNRIPATAGTFVSAIAIPITRCSNLQRSSDRRNIRSSNRNRSQLHKLLLLYLLVNSIRNRRFQNGNMGFLRTYLGFHYQKKPLLLNEKLKNG
jgi:hypothetical protein